MFWMGPGPVTRLACISQMWGISVAIMGNFAFSFVLFHSETHTHDCLVQDKENSIETKQDKSDDNK
jgi:hypothetical protein